MRCAGRVGRGFSRTGAFWLRDRRPPAPGRAARRGGARDPPVGRRLRRAAAAPALRRAAPPHRARLQHGRRRPARPSARRRAEDPPAELPRVLRAPALRLRPGHGWRHGGDRAAPGALRPGPALRGRGPARLGGACRDLRGPLGAGAAERGGRAGRRHGARQSFGQQHHRRQGRYAAAALPVAIGAMPRGLCLRRCRRGGVHHGPRLGRPGLDFRERRHAQRKRALPRGRPDRGGRCGPRPTSSGARAPRNLRRQPAPQRGSGRVPARFLPPRSSDGGCRLRAEGRAVPLRAGRPGAALAGLLRGVQHPGLGPGAAARRGARAAHRHRRLRRARTRPRR